MSCSESNGLPSGKKPAAARDGSDWAEKPPATAPAGNNEKGDSQKKQHEPQHARAGHRQKIPSPCRRLAADVLDEFAQLFHASSSSKEGNPRLNAIRTTSETSMPLRRAIFCTRRLSARGTRHDTRMSRGRGWAGKFLFIVPPRYPKAPKGVNKNYLTLFATG